MKNVDIALLIWQRNRVREALGLPNDPVYEDAWEGICNFIDSVIDETHPPSVAGPSKPLPPPYRPWSKPYGDGPTTTDECWIDFVDSRGGMSESDTLWDDYVSMCTRCRVDPKTKET
jgi:hypothetical protein